MIRQKAINFKVNIYTLQRVDTLLFNTRQSRNGWMNRALEIALAVERLNDHKEVCSGNMSLDDWRAIWKDDPKIPIEVRVLIGDMP